MRRTLCDLWHFFRWNVAPAAILLGLAILLSCVLSGCSTPTDAPEAYICADPDVRVEKGGRQACLKYFRAFSQTACGEARSTLECVDIVQSLENAGFSPSPDDLVHQ